MRDCRKKRIYFAYPLDNMQTKAHNKNIRTKQGAHDMKNITQKAFLDTLPRSIYLIDREEIPLLVKLYDRGIIRSATGKELGLKELLPSERYWAKK
jgi:hypothetical protein